MLQIHGPLSKTLEPDYSRIERVPEFSNEVAYAKHCIISLWSGAVLAIKYINISIVKPMNIHTERKKEGL